MPMNKYTWARQDTNQNHSVLQGLLCGHHPTFGTSARLGQPTLEQLATAVSSCSPDSALPWDGYPEPCRNASPLPYFCTSYNRAELWLFCFWHHAKQLYKRRTRCRKILWCWDLKGIFVSKGFLNRVIGNDIYREVQYKKLCHVDQHPQ